MGDEAGIVLVYLYNILCVYVHVVTLDSASVYMCFRKVTVREKCTMPSRECNVLVRVYMYKWSNMLGLSQIPKHMSQYNNYDGCTHCFFSLGLPPKH